MRTLTPTDLAYVDRAPVRATLEVTLAAPPARVFAAFADAAGWPRWFPLMHRAAWTRGHGGLGDEREVRIRGLGRFAERMIAWEPGVRYAFTMTGTSSPMLAAMAEDYRLTADGAGTRVSWTMAATPTALGRAAKPVLVALTRRMLRRAFHNLDRQLGR